LNWGQNLFNLFSTNVQPLVLMAIAAIGVYLGFKREFTKMVGFLVVALVAVGLVFNTAGSKDVLLKIFNTVIGARMVMPDLNIIYARMVIPDMSMVFNNLL